MKSPFPATYLYPQSRSPHGERGLKFKACRVSVQHFLSLPARGAWIEMVQTLMREKRLGSLPARGAWIEISARLSLSACSCRSPHGERGLKYRSYPLQNEGYLSLPARGAWIEMRFGRAGRRAARRSPHGERGLKSHPRPARSGRQSGSLPARGAWIEMQRCMPICTAEWVAPRTGSVD